MSGFASGLMMVVGVLIALTTGLCSLAGTAIIIAMVASATRAMPGDTVRVLLLLAMPAAGFAMTAFGIWLFRRGRARARGD
jgi:hypothetical protein